jgi:two-component system, NtrC family, nitrogen regulation sensor histidine kinase NtrY
VSRLNTSFVLLFTIALLFLLLALYLFQLGWSLLALITLFYIACWPAFGFWYWLHRREQLQWQQMSSYVMALQEGETNYRLISHYLSAPAQQLCQQLMLFTQSKQQDDSQQNVLFSALWQHFPYPVCVFDATQHLLYANTAASQSLQRPLLRGSEAGQLGFTEVKGDWFHPDLQTGWQQYSVRFLLQGQQCVIYYASDLRHPLYQQQKASQQQLIKVLSHELRNSLTPMASMSETLLAASELPQAQTRQVLSRIRQRSQRLLGFIENYVQLQQLPAAQPQWLNLTELLNEMPQADYVQFSGEIHCYADPEQLAQLLLNILKNAVEACSADTEKTPEINLSFYYLGDQQLLTLTDNGPGFANMDNLFTPFYTTKQAGSGVGLMLCQEIMHLHDGTIRASNTSAGHGCIELRWPLPAAAKA